MPVECRTNRFGYARFQDVMICAHSKQNPLGVDWDAYIAASRELLDAHGTIRVLVHSLGGGPNVTQRAEISRLFDGRPQKVAVLQDSLIARGIIAALGLFNPSIRGFSLDAREAAYAHLSLSPSEGQRIGILLDEILESIAAAPSP